MDRFVMTSPLFPNPLVPNVAVLQCVFINGNIDVQCLVYLKPIHQLYCLVLSFVSNLEHP